MDYAVSWHAMLLFCRPMQTLANMLLFYLNATGFKLPLIDNHINVNHVSVSILWRSINISIVSFYTYLLDVAEFMLSFVRSFVRLFVCFVLYRNLFC